MKIDFKKLFVARITSCLLIFVYYYFNRSSAKLYWGDENKIEVKLDKEAESLIKKLILDRYKTIYQRYYNSERFEAALNQEEIDLGNELVEYLKKLYHTPPVVQMSRLPYTSTRRE